MNEDTQNTGAENTATDEVAATAGEGVSTSNEGESNTDTAAEGTGEQA